MRKLFIVTGAIAFLGIQNLTIANASDWQWGGSASRENWLTRPKSDPTPPPPSKEYLETVKLLKEQLGIYKNQLLTKEKTYNSITGKRDMLLQMQSHQVSSHFLNPYLIYDKELIMQNHDLKSAYMRALNHKGNISKNENNPHQVREIINDRLQYATMIDKAISQQALTQVENRFQKIADISAILDKMNDLKGLAEVQVHIDGVLAMIQNEATKLQMVAYSREAEQARIKQQKHALYSYAFKQKHKKMPQIRINSSTLGSS